MILVTLVYMEGWTYLRTYVRTVDDVMAIKPRFLASMGCHIFLTMMLRARAATGCSAIKALFQKLVAGQGIYHQLSEKGNVCEEVGLRLHSLNIVSRKMFSTLPYSCRQRVSVQYGILEEPARSYIYSCTCSFEFTQIGN